MRVLLVDDSQSFLHAASEFLRAKDATIILDMAATPEEAIAAISRVDHDVVMLDLKLGAVSGWVVLRDALKLRPDLPVIMLSGYGNVDIAQEAAALGAYAFLHKPVDPDVFYSVIKRAALRRSLRRREPAISPHHWTSAMQHLRSRIQQVDARVRQTLDRHEKRGEDA